MSDPKKIYEALSYIVDQKSRSAAFYLNATDTEYHLLSDGDMVILVTLNRSENSYEISTMNFVGQWIDVSLETLMQTQGGPDYDTLWRHLRYFNITPDKIYDLYSNDTFVYKPSYESEEEQEQQTR